MNADHSNAPPRENRLSGQTILVTRPAEQADALVSKIERLGGTAIVHPVIEIHPPDHSEALNTAISTLPDYGVIVFASRNGVKFFAEQLQTLDATLPAHQLVAAIGSSTAQLIHEAFGIQAIVPSQSDSQGLAQLLQQRFNDQKLLLVRGNRGSSALHEQLTAADVDFDSVVAYRSLDVMTPAPDVVQLLQTGQIDWITATSSSIGRAAVKLFGDWLATETQENQTGKAKLVSISPTTSQAIRSAGSVALAEAVEFNLDGLVAAMCRPELP